MNTGTLGHVRGYFQMILQSKDSVRQVSITGFSVKKLQVDQLKLGKLYNHFICTYRVINTLVVQFQCSSIQ